MTQTFSSRAWYLLLFAWLVALVSTLAALFIGEVLGQQPCVLCWYQRILMFPLAILLAIACFRSDFEIWRYALPLSVIGGLFALGHSLLYAGIIPQQIQPCSPTGPSCTDANTTLFGVIPLPFLALLAFILISATLLIVRRRTTP